MWKLLCLFSFVLSTAADIFADVNTENEMDGEALSTLLAAVQGPDCLKDLVPKLGVRLKVYKRIKMLCDHEVCSVHCFVISQVIHVLAFPE